jgi:hypothetical protein
MKGTGVQSLIVVESMFGNTRQIAEAVATGLASCGSVDVVEVADAPGTVPDEVDLLVVGGPTHAFGMTRDSTRKDAVRQGAPVDAGRDTGRLREWLSGLPRAEPARMAAAFDTRVEKVHHLPGSAARGAAKALRRRGYRLVVEAESFWVHDTPGPLINDELHRASGWGERVGSAATEQG